jgi:hypothetical protein
MTDDRAGGPRVPTAAAWLDSLGLLPFVGLSLAFGLATGPLKATAAQGLLGYGSVILSFLGGIYWGTGRIYGRPRARPTKEDRPAD